MFTNIAQVIMHLKLCLGFIFAAIALSTSVLAIPGSSSTVPKPPFNQELDKEQIDWLDWMVARYLLLELDASMAKENPELFHRFLSRGYNRHKRCHYGPHDDDDDFN
jgi:hypothetical protein